MPGRQPLMGAAPVGRRTPGEQPAVPRQPRRADGALRRAEHPHAGEQFGETTRSAGPPTARHRDAGAQRQGGRWQAYRGDPVADLGLDTRDLPIADPAPGLAPTAQRMLDAARRILDCDGYNAP